MYPKIPEGEAEIPKTWEQFIQKAEFKVKSIIGLRYDVNFTSVPPLLKNLTIDLAATYIYRVAFQSTSLLPNQNNEAIEEKIMQQLRDIADGKELLYDENDTLISQKSGMGTMNSSTSQYTPTFDMDTERTWEVDPDLLDDIADTRDI
jgi:hypothetical protein